MWNAVWTGILYVAGTVGVCLSIAFYAGASRRKAPQILPLEDSEIAETIETSLKKQGIKFIIGVGAESLKKNEASVEVTLNDEEKTILTSDKVLVAIGRKTNIGEIDLGSTAVKID